MGVVYRGRRLTDGRDVAIKTVRVTKPSLLSSIRREIAALAELDHPGVVKILDHGVDDGLPWYAMELLSGQSLRDFLSSDKDTTVSKLIDSKALTLDRATEIDVTTACDSTLADATTMDVLPPHYETTVDVSTLANMATDLSPIGRLLHKASEIQVEPTAAVTFKPGAVKIVAAVCETLAYLHGEGVIHRDLKPDNVLVLEDGRVVLVDFGLAVRAMDELGRECIENVTAGAGTLWYMSPEQIQAQWADARADLYSLGCVLYECLSGHPPFMAKSAFSIAVQHLSQPPPPLSQVEHLPPELERLTYQLLEKQREKRPG